MPSPTSVAELLELVRKSGVIEDKRLDSYVAKLHAAGDMPADPPKLAGAMVRDGILTHFQAEQFLMGKWRRFTIGKYKVLERLGAGGMGSVYLCEHKLMRRRVAVKVLPTAKAEDPAALERFYREARAVAALDHPNIVRAYDIDQDEKLHFLVMEHVDGANLQEIVKKSGPLDVARAAHYVRQSALGLQHAHETAGLVHRDVKPGNILVDRNGIVKVLDMGLARFFHDEDDSITKKYDENVLGTADYLAPEQAINSHEVDIRADIYSLGATLYFCLTGKTPFSEGSVAQKLIWHQTRQPKSIKGVRPEVPDGLVAVVEKAMAKDPAQRYADPLAMGDALAPWTQSPIPPPAAAEMPQLSRAAMGNAMASGDSSGAGNGASTAANVGTASPPSRRTWLVAGHGPASGTPPVQRGDSDPSGAAESRDTGVTSAAVVATAESPVLPPPQPVPAATQPRSGAKAPAASALARSSTAAPASAYRTSAPAQPVVPAPLTEEDSPSWEKLAGDTEDLTARADTASNSRRRASPSSRGRRAPSGRSSGRESLMHALDARQRFWLSAGIVGVVLILLILILWWAAPPAPKSEKAAVVPPTGHYVVSAADAGGINYGLVTRLRAAKTGDLIEIDGDIALSDFNTAIVGAKNVTLQGREGKSIVWRGDGKGSKLLILSHTAGWKLRNMTFDGEGKVDSIITLFGDCPGLTLDRVQFRGFRKYALWVLNCAGKPDQRVVLSDLSFATTQPNQAGIFFDINANVPTNTKNQSVEVRPFKFDGPGAPVRVRNQSIALDEVQLPAGTTPVQGP